MYVKIINVSHTYVYIYIITQHSSAAFLFIEMKQLGNDWLFCSINNLMKMKWFHLENLTIKMVRMQQSIVDEFWGGKNGIGEWAVEGTLIGNVLL